MNARYYLPEIGRFISADTIVPDPQNPQSYNRYSYTLNNPVNYVDPSGHRECFISNDGGQCIPISSDPPQYDLTSWLVPEMSINAESPELKYVRTNLQAAGINDVPGFILGMYQFYVLNSNDGIWNIKVPIFERLSDGIVLCGAGSCRWVDYSTPGNIHFGFMVAAGNVPLGDALIAGGMLESLDRFNQSISPAVNLEWKSTLYDNPGDFTAVIFGYALYQEYGTDITVAEFQQALTIDILDAFQPPPAGFVPPGPAVPQPNRYPPGAFNND